MSSLICAPVASRARGRRGGGKELTTDETLVRNNDKNNRKSLESAVFVLSCNLEMFDAFYLIEWHIPPRQSYVMAIAPASTGSLDDC